MNEYESDTLCFMRSYERNSPSRDVRLFIHLSLFLFLHPFYLSVPHYSFIHIHISTYQTGLLILPKYASSNGRQQSPAYYHQRGHSPAEHSLAVTASLLHLFDMKLHIIVSLTISISFKTTRKQPFQSVI